MADSGIKKAKILEAALPPQNIYAQGHIVRYRIISEDQNRTSSWSPMIIVQPNYTFTPGTCVANKSGSLVSVVWDSVKIYKGTQFIKNSNEYDIWLRWHRGTTGDWMYKQSSLTTNASFVIPTTYTVDGIVQGSAPNKLDIEIYLKGTPISRDATFLKVYTVIDQNV